MGDVQDNIVEFKKACDCFGIYFSNTDGVKSQVRSVAFYIDNFSSPRYLLNAEVAFWQKSSDATISIEALDGKNLHSEVTARYCEFKFDEGSRSLKIKGSSKKYNHNFQIIIS